MKILDSVCVRVGEEEIYLSVEYDLEFNAFRIVGVEEYPNNPLIIRKPRDEREVYAVEFLRKFLEENPRKVLDLFGRTIKARAVLALE